MAEGEWPGLLWTVVSAQLPVRLPQAQARWNLMHFGHLWPVALHGRKARERLVRSHGSDAERAVREVFARTGFNAVPVSDFCQVADHDTGNAYSQEFVPLGALRDRSPFEEREPAFSVPSPLRFASPARFPDRKPYFYEPVYDQGGLRLGQHIDLVVSCGTDSVADRDSELADEVRLDLAQLLATRRWFAFAPEIAKRLFIVSLPPALACIQGGAGGSEGTKQDGDLRFLVCCFLSLLRVPNDSAFRKTVSLTVFLVPVQRTSEDIDGRNLEAMELAAILRRRYPGFRYRTRRDTFRLSGPLLDGLLGSELRPEEAASGHTLRWWSEQILAALARRLCGERQVSGSDISTSLWTSSLMSWGSGAALLRLPGESESSEERILEVLGVESRALEELRIRSRQRDHYDLLYVPGHGTLIGLLEERAEQFPASSVLGLAVTLSFMTASLSALHAMTNAFHHAVEATGRTAQLLTTSGEFVGDFEELYDLDLLVPDYKRAFERVKELDGADRDYQYLRGYLESLTSTMTAQSTQRSSELTILLSGFIVVLTTFLVNSPQWIRWVVTILAGLFALGGLAWVSVSATHRRGYRP